MEYKLYKSWRKAVPVALGSALFVVVSLLLSLKKEPAPWYVVWAGIGFFTPCMLVGLYNLLDRRPQIILDEKGIYDRTLHREAIPWAAIRYAYPVKSHGVCFIALALDESFIARLKMSAWSRLNRAVGFQPFNLNLVYINANPEKLCTVVLLLARLAPEERATFLEVLADGGIPLR
jgi:hypothetical protein